jgi:two-component sensor histidine kinase/tetratricopeptide (TPR) repeat protein
MPKQIQILLLFLFCNYYGFSQFSDKKTPSEIIPNLKDLTEKLKHYHHIEPNADSAYQIIARGKKITENNSELIKIPSEDTLTSNTFARLYDQIGYFYFEKSDYLNALRYFSLSLGIYEQTSNHKEEGYNAQNVAAIFRQVGDDSEALRYAQRALLVLEQLEDDDGVAISLYTLAILHREQGDIQIADEYAERALSIYTRINDLAGKARLYNLLAGINRDYKDDESALNYYYEALRIYEDINLPQGIANITNNIGVILRDQEKFEESIAYFNRATAISDSVDYKRGKVFSMVNLADVNYRAGNYKNAKEIGKQALDLARKILDIESVKKGAEFMIRVYQNESNWQKAFEMQEIVLETEKQISKQKKEQMLEYESIRFNYERDKILEEKEREKANSISAYQKDRQKIILIAAGVFILFLIFSLFIGYAKLRDSKKKNTQIQKQSDERKLLLQEVHHRVKNNFQIVSSLLRLQYYTLENKEFSKVFEEAIMRINAMSIVHDIIYRQEAFSDINAQLYFDKLLEQLKRLSDKDVKTEALISCGHLKIETLIHLGIITNELFINSLKYGFNGKLSDPKVKVVLTQKENHFELNYFENGKGLSKDEYKKSFGMDLISTIIEQHDGKVSIEDVTEPWSTHIKVVFVEDAE